MFAVKNGQSFHNNQFRLASTKALIIATTILIRSINQTKRFESTLISKFQNILFEIRKFTGDGIFADIIISFFRQLPEITNDKIRSITTISRNLKSDKWSTIETFLSLSDDEEHNQKICNVIFYLIPFLIKFYEVFRENYRCQQEIHGSKNINNIILKFYDEEIFKAPLIELKLPKIEENEEFQNEKNFIEWLTENLDLNFNSDFSWKDNFLESDNWFFD
jgi:hypothetical protein